MCADLPHPQDPEPTNHSDSAASTWIAIADSTLPPPELPPDEPAQWVTEAPPPTSPTTHPTAPPTVSLPSLDELFPEPSPTPNPTAIAVEPGIDLEKKTQVSVGESPESPVQWATSHLLQTDGHTNHFNNTLAILITVLATFMGLGAIKNQNIMTAMQQIESDRVNQWTWYQARNIRAEIANTTAQEMRLYAATQSPAVRKLYDKPITALEAESQHQTVEKEKQRQAAKEREVRYEQLGRQSDQLDLADAFLSIAIALLAVTSLFQKRWLFGFALIPSGLGLLMGCAGFWNWPIYLDAASQILSQSTVLPTDTLPLEQNSVSDQLTPTTPRP